jgi:hypothetical protein
MHDLSDAFIVLPGGFGTMEEFLETLTLAQLGLHTKPVAVVNAGSFFTPFCGGCSITALPPGSLRRRIGPAWCSSTPQPTSKPGFAGPCSSASEVTNDVAAPERHGRVDR